MSTEIQTSCTLRRPFDIVFNALSTMGITQFNLYKMYALINIVITRVENVSPDMILVAFERKFEEEFDEMPPGICRHHMLQIIQYWGWEDCHKNTKMVINGVIWGPHGSEFCMHLSFISTNIFEPQRYLILIKIIVFEGFWGVIKVEKYYI